MAKSIKLKNNTYWDSSSIAHNKEKLSDILNSEFIYSTSEVKTNKVWLDGKPIYRKTLLFNTNLTKDNPVTISHKILNIDKIWYDASSSFLYNGSLFLVLPIFGYNNISTEYLYFQMDKSNITFYSSGWGEWWSKAITLLYTKTTD